MRYKFALIWTILPLILYATFLYTGKDSFPGWKFSIEAYDPRDPVMGHYMQYRYKDPQLQQYTMNVACVLKGQEGMDNPTIKVVSRTLLSKLPQGCTRIKLKPGGMGRFYIDERYGQMLESALRDKQLPMKVELAHVPFLNVTMMRELYIGDQTYHEFIRSR
jgi:hypothetical protein